MFMCKYYYDAVMFIGDILSMKVDPNIIMELL